jgi:hypothetical protein
MAQIDIDGLSVLFACTAVLVQASGQLEGWLMGWLLALRHHGLDEKTGQDCQNPRPARKLQYRSPKMLM